MSVLENILEWVLDKPLWWQDAVRQLIENNEINDHDINKLTLLCKACHGLIDSYNPPPEPKVLSCTPRFNDDKVDITLQSISDIQNVNALAEDQELIFADKGFTIIYGDNGSGKSGYTRILKHVCRTRGQSPKIHKNLLKPGKIAAPSATIKYKCNGIEQPPLNWEYGANTNPMLRLVSVFDATSATHYVESEGEIAFRPFGLDILDKLGNVCDVVRRNLETEMREHAQQIDLNHLSGDTAVGKFVNMLACDTKEEDIKKLAILSEEEIKRLVALPKEIAKLRAEDPKRKAAEIRLTAERIIKFQDKLKKIATSLSNEKINELRKLHSDYFNAEASAGFAAELAFGNQPLKGVGTDVWKALWESARIYSEEFAYPEKKFPNIADGTLCPLCQQELENNGKQRFINFEEFVKGDTQAKAKELSEKFVLSREAIGKIESILTDNDNAIREIEQKESKLAELCSAFLASALNTRNSILAAYENVDRWEGVTSLWESPVNALDGLSSELHKEAADFEKAADSDHLTSLEKEYQELFARKKLSESITKVIEEIKRLNIVNQLENCLKETNPRSITFLSNSLTKEYITDTLCSNFADELKIIGFRNIEVEIKTRGLRGAHYHRLKLAGNDEVNIGEVLSEGEHRCVALASLLSEASTAKHLSGIVFDDPVSSLDHLWRAKIAKRLAVESKKRQVIILTHDITFLMMLEEASGELSIEPKIYSLDRTRTTTGICSESPPWYSMNVNKRIGILKNNHREAQKVYNEGTTEQYKTFVRPLYGQLRETWERLVEELLLNGVVHRFGRDIQTQRLRLVVDITSEDYELIDSNMRKCSKFFEGHDEAGELNEVLPEPDEVFDDIQVLENYRKELCEKRKRSPRR